MINPMECKTLLDALAFIAKRSGKDVLHNRSFVIACLKDLLPDQKAARNVLDAAFAMGVAEKFDEACGKAVNRQQMALSQCCMRLCDDHGFERELVEDVLWAYGIALGFDARPEPKQAQPHPAPSPPPPAPKPSYQPRPQPSPLPVPRPSSQTQPRPQPFQPPVLLPKQPPMPTLPPLQPLQPSAFDPKPKSWLEKSWAERTGGEKALLVIGIILLIPILLFATMANSSGKGSRRRSSSWGGSPRRRSRKSGWYN
jgi:hypothetical protein